MINQTMPPIAGVAQGAMVLHDAILPDLDIDRLQKVLQPKVDGSIYLDELFQDNQLDFFVFFSSLAYVVGNRGQAAYMAANAFMASLAARRREQGLAASVINIGGIIGQGYISRQLGLGKQMLLRKAGIDFMSEQAFHETFAEGVLAGNSELSQESFEISTGLRIDEEEDREKSWLSNPIFQHLVSSRQKGESNFNDVRNTVHISNIKSQLLSALTDEERLGIIRG
jgi:hybrid polyketide synthase/nonribosomal peptide synthetase ACE1